MTAALDVLAGACLVVGALLMAVAGLGLHRYADPAVRLHVAAKASSGGVLLVLLGAGLASAELAVALEFGLTGVFLLVSVPLATHGLARAVVDPEDEVPTQGAPDPRVAPRGGPPEGRSHETG